MHESHACGLDIKLTHQGQYFIFHAWLTNPDDLFFNKTDNKIKFNILENIPKSRLNFHCSLSPPLEETLFEGGAQAYFPHSGW